MSTIHRRTIAWSRGMVVAAIACVALVSCAHALKEPPGLMEVLGGARGHGPGDVDALLKSGEERFAQRKLDSVKAALEDFTAAAAAAADPARSEGLRRAIAAWVWLTDHEADAPARQDAATRAVQAAQWCGRRSPDDAACDYWMGAALGVQARERPSTGLSALPAIESAFKKAAERAPLLEEAGPERALALLYLRAPGWPTGPGDPDQGLQHARRALELRPDYPPNLLTLGEALTATGDAEAGRAAYQKALDLARQVHGRGEAEAREWIDEATKALSSSPGAAR